MTEQSPNSQFRASSFLDGANADYIDQMAAKHAADPSSVDASWAAFFAAMNESDRVAEAAAAGPSWARADWPPMPVDDLTAALTGEWAPEAETKSVAKKIQGKAADAGVEVSADKARVGGVVVLGHHVLHRGREGPAASLHFIPS